MNHLRSTSQKMDSYGIAYTEIRKESGILQYKFYNNGEKSTVLTFADALQFFVQHDRSFNSIMKEIISRSERAIYFECAPFSAANMKQKQFEFVTLPATSLERSKVDIKPFIEKFYDNFQSQRKLVTVFKNLGGDSLLIAPCPIDSYGKLTNPASAMLDSHQHMTHLASFLAGPRNGNQNWCNWQTRNDSGDESQQLQLWAALGEEARRIAENSRRKDTPLWISTDGRGVSWLHLRIDSTPKYYKFAEYKNPKWDPPQETKLQSANKLTLESNHSANEDMSFPSSIASIPKPQPLHVSTPAFKQESTTGGHRQSIGPSLMDSPYYPTSSENSNDFQHNKSSRRGYEMQGPFSQHNPALSNGLVSYPPTYQYPNGPSEISPKFSSQAQAQARPSTPKIQRSNPVDGWHNPPPKQSDPYQMSSKESAWSVPTKRRAMSTPKSRTNFQMI